MNIIQQALTLVNGRWVDANNNSWNADFDTIESATHKSKSLIGCSYCSGCRGFKENPERITSPKIGSRADNTTVYWVGDDIRVVCGCFRGNLSEFEQAIEKSHGDNEHGKAYKKFINKVKAYMQ